MNSEPGKIKANYEVRIKPFHHQVYIENVFKNLWQIYFSEI